MTKAEQFIENLQKIGDEQRRACYVAKEPYGAVIDGTFSLDELESALPEAMPLTLVSKLASLAVHTDELFTADGRCLDRNVLIDLARDPEVVAWVESLGALAPVKRQKKASPVSALGFSENLPVLPGELGSNSLIVRAPKRRS